MNYTTQIYKSKDKNFIKKWQIEFFKNITKMLQKYDFAKNIKKSIDLFFIIVIIKSVIYKK